jgi:phosphoribosylanthranilate isomerase
MFQVKICGITTVADALHAVASGADAIGLNFYPQSTRCVLPDTASEISKAVAGRTLRVGVTVNMPEGELTTLLRQAALDAIQLHGDEPPELIAKLAPIPVIKAFRYRDSLAPLREYMQECLRLNRLPSAVLLDAFHPEQFGGTGLPINFAELLTEELSQILHGRPWVLAGGLTPENVAHAIRTACPSGVDVASGVESSPGIKDAKKVSAFVQAACSALSK